jgi:hypothetical protein
MQVEIEFHAAARTDLIGWVRSLGRTPGERMGFAATYLDDMVDQFRAHRGRPPGVNLLSPLIESVWTWEYQAGLTWLLYQLRPAGGFWARLFGRQVLRVVIFGVFTRPPTHEDLVRLARETRRPR